MSKEKYYILKCPICDKDITEVMEYPNNEVYCPHCDKKLNLYSVFGYNMWLSENGKATKVNKKPIKDVINNTQYDEFTYDNDDYDFDEEVIRDEFINSCSLIQKRPEVLHEIASFNADMCLMQYRYLIKVGFTRFEALEIILKLIEQSFLL